MTHKSMQEVRTILSQAVITENIRSMVPTQDPAMDGLIEKITMAALVSSNVVITGESGTGKELIAQALHHCGVNQQGPFVAFNCAALTESLLESELFGHTKGAFTDAKEAKPGLFARANFGTLFIDEIGDAPLATQAKLLRVLQEREVLPIGSSTPVPIYVRVIAATHKSLADEVAAGRFRQDLFYRLHVIPLHAPSLKERPLDILFLATHFAKLFANEMKLSFEGFTSEAVTALEANTWPGNIRELQNRIEHAMAIQRGGELSMRSLFPETSGQDASVDPLSTLSLTVNTQVETTTQETPAVSTMSQQPIAHEKTETETLKEKSKPRLDLHLPTFQEAKIAFEKNYLFRLLNAARGNIAKAARMASKSRTEVYQLIKKHKINPIHFKTESTEEIPSENIIPNVSENISTDSTSNPGLVSEIRVRETGHFFYSAEKS